MVPTQSPFLKLFRGDKKMCQKKMCRKSVRTLDTTCKWWWWWYIFETLKFQLVHIKSDTNCSTPPCADNNRNDLRTSSPLHCTIWMAPFWDFYTNKKC